MLSQCDNFRQKYTDVTYAIFRVLVGLLFMFHGAQKLFGVFTEREAISLAGSGPMSLFGVNLMWFAGFIEFFGGILVALGLLTVFAAAFNGFVMIVAYFYAHQPSAVLPITNGGEMALLYLAAFICIAFQGGGKYSVDALLGRSQAPARSSAGA